MRVIDMSYKSKRSLVINPETVRQVQELAHREKVSQTGIVSLLVSMLYEKEILFDWDEARDLYPDRGTGAKRRWQTMEKRIHAQVMKMRRQTLSVRDFIATASGIDYGDYRYSSKQVERVLSNWLRDGRMKMDEDGTTVTIQDRSFFAQELDIDS